MTRIPSRPASSSLRWIARAVFACVLVASTIGCKSTPEFPPKWTSEEVNVPSGRLLWEVTVFALEKEHFPVGSGLDPTTLSAVSGWKHSLAPFKNKGWREQAEVRYAPVAPGRFKVEVRIAHETNEDMVRPLDLRYAKWKKAADNEEAAQILLQRIKAWVGVGATAVPKLPPPKAPASKTPASKGGGSR